MSSMILPPENWKVYTRFWIEVRDIPNKNVIGSFMTFYDRFFPSTPYCVDQSISVGDIILRGHLEPQGWSVSFSCYSNKDTTVM